MSAIAHLEAEPLETAIQSVAIFEAACQRYLKISTDEFLTKWDGGFFRGDSELASRAADVALLLPLVRAR